MLLRRVAGLVRYLKGASADPRRAERAEALVGIVVSTVLWAVRLVAGYALNSVALIADAWHSLSDSLTSAVVLVASKMASKPADAEHPYGHGKAADVASAALGAMLILIAANVVREALAKYASEEGLVLEHAKYGLLIVALTAIVKEWLARWALSLGRKTGSTLCTADAWHHRLDALLTAGVGLSIALYALFRFHVIDLAVAVVIAGIMAAEGAKIAWNSVSSLMDKNVEQVVKVAERLSKEVAGVLAAHRIRARSYGGYFALEMNLHVKADLTVEEAHRIAHEVERRIKEVEPRVVHVQIHVEPHVDHE